MGLQRARVCYTARMKLTQETFAILGVGAGLLVGLGGLQLSLHGDLSRRIDTLAAGQAEVRERLARVETHLAIPAATDTTLAVTVKPGSAPEE